MPEIKTKTTDWGFIATVCLICLIAVACVAAVW